MPTSAWWVHHRQSRAVTRSSLARVGINPGQYQKIFKTSLEEDFEEISRLLQENDLWDRQSQVTPKGMFYADTIAGLLAWQKSISHRINGLAKQEASIEPPIFEFDLNRAHFLPMG